MEEQTNSEPAQHVTSLWLRDGEIRVPWKLATYIGSSVTLSVLFGLVMFVIPGLPFDLAPAAIPFGVLCGIGVSTLLCMRVMEQKGFLDIGLHPRSRGLRNLGFGLATALVMVAVITAIQGSLDMLDVRTVAVTAGHGMRILGSGAVLFLVAGTSEELMMRGYPLQVLARRFGGPVALLSTSLAFAALHAPNPSLSWIGVLNLVLAGLWLGSAYLASGSLWLPIGLHVGWNFAMGSIAGFPVSGLTTRGLFLFVERGPDWLTGGSFGPEGGIIATCVLLPAIAALRLPVIRRIINDTRAEPAPVT